MAVDANTTLAEAKLRACGTIFLAVADALAGDKRVDGLHGQIIAAIYELVEEHADFEVAPGIVDAVDRCGSRTE